MAKHILTQETINQLRLSPYILSVTQSQIRYTDELRALYYQQKDQFESGIDWLRSVGLGPELIGRKRAVFCKLKVQKIATKNYTTLLSNYFLFNLYVTKRVLSDSFPP